MISIYVDARESIILCKDGQYRLAFIWGLQWEFHGRCARESHGRCKRACLHIRFFRLLLALLLSLSPILSLNMALSFIFICILALIRFFTRFFRVLVLASALQQ